MRSVASGIAGAILAVALLATGHASAVSVQLAALDEGAAGGRAGDQELPWTSVMRDVQQALRDLGYYKGPVDGRPNGAIEKAIRKYQLEQGIAGEASATPDLLSHLRTLSQSARIDRNLDQARQEQTALAREALGRNMATRDLLRPVAVGAVAPPGNGDACFREPTVRCLLAEALATAMAVQRPDYRHWALRDIIRVQASIGDYEAARDSIRHLADPRLILVALREVTEALAAAGRVAEAAALAETIPDLPNKTKALAAVAAAEAAQGRFEAAHHLGERVLGLLETDSNLVGKIEVATGIAVQLELAGDNAGALAMMQRAHKIAADAQNGAARDAALGALARAYSEMGYADRVLQMLGGSNDQPPTVIAAATFTRPDPGSESKRAMTLDAARYRVLALSDIAVAQFRLGAPGAARETLQAALSAAEMIKAAFPKDYALARIAASQAETGREAEAVTTALRVTNAAVRVRCLWGIADAQRLRGDESAVRDIAARAAKETAELANVFERVLILAELAWDRAASGRLDEARSLLDQAMPAIRSVRTDWWRARALAEVAGALHAIENTAGIRSP